MTRVVATTTGVVLSIVPLAAGAADFTGAWLIEQTTGAQPPSATESFQEIYHARH